jgi:hypothetical protein
VSLAIFSTNPVFSCAYNKNNDLYEGGRGKVVVVVVVVVGLNFAAIMTSVIGNIWFFKDI